MIRDIIEKYREKPRDEEGSNIVQMVLVIPMIMVVVVFIVQMGIVSYETSMLSSQISRAIAATDVHDLTTMNTDTARTTLARRIQSQVPIFNTSDTAVWIDSSSTAFSIITENTKVVKSKPSGVSSKINELRDYETTIHVTGTLHYRLPSYYAYTVFDGMVVDRDINFIQTSNSRFELKQS